MRVKSNLFLIIFARFADGAPFSEPLSWKKKIKCINGFVNLGKSCSGDLKSTQKWCSNCREHKSHSLIF